MRALTSVELLRIWEHSFEQSAIEKALHLLAVACSVSDLHTIAQWSIEQRDARLFRLREWMFGKQLNNTAHCPNCTEQVEWEMSITDFPIPAWKEEEMPSPFNLQFADYSIRFRSPNSEDLMQADAQKILANCMLEIKKEREDITFSDLPDEVIDALNQEMEKTNPLSNITMLLNCPACNHQWQVVFDILGYLWTEIDHWAKRTLQEVYLLARAFSWSEQDILSMSNRKRQIYLSMLTS